MLVLDLSPSQVDLLLVGSSAVGRVTGVREQLKVMSRDQSEQEVITD